MADDGIKDVLSAAAYAAAMVYGTLAITDESNTTTFEYLACRAPAASTDITVIGAQLGIVLADQARAQNPAFTNPVYPQGAMVPCLRQGRVWVNSESAVTDGTAPYVRYGAGGSGIDGNFAGASGANLAQMPSTQAVFRGTTAAAGYAVVEIDLV
ncbi:unnamed protein product [Sphagnum balticum]